MYFETVDWATFEAQHEESAKGSPAHPADEILSRVRFAIVNIPSHLFRESAGKRTTRVKGSSPYPDDELPRDS
jgi:hypothetical protein